MSMKTRNSFQLALLATDILTYLLGHFLDLRIKSSLDCPRECLHIECLWRNRLGSCSCTVDRVTPELLVTKERDDDTWEPVTQADGGRTGT